MNEYKIKTDDTPNLLLMVGPSCSGKSTFARKRAKEGYYIISRDNFREHLFGEYRQGNKEEENMITDMVKGSTIMLLSMGYNVVLDATHLREAYIKDTLTWFGDFADIHIHFMPQVSLETLNERNALRSATTGKTIPAFVIENHFKAFQNLIDTYKGEKFYPRN